MYNYHTPTQRAHLYGFPGIITHRKQHNFLILAFYMSEIKYSDSEFTR